MWKNASANIGNAQSGKEQTMNEICEDNRFEIIAKAKAHLLDATNIGTSKDEMKVLDSFLFRCWQMGWLDRYDTADRKTEPQTERSRR